MIMIICLCAVAGGLPTFCAPLQSCAFWGLIERFQFEDETPWRLVTSGELSSHVTMVVKYFDDQTYLSCLDGRLMAPTIMPTSFLCQSHLFFRL